VPFQHRHAPHSPSHAVRDARLFQFQQVLYPRLLGGPLHRSSPLEALSDLCANYKIAAGSKNILSSYFSSPSFLNSLAKFFITRKIDLNKSKNVLLIQDKTYKHCFQKEQ
jgi:hypothetical protein